MKKIVVLILFILIVALVIKSFNKETTTILKEEEKMRNINNKKFSINDMGIKDKKEIYLGGGCFWGVEGYFQKLDGVIDTEVGYANGKTEDTVYEKLSETDHAEVLKVTFDENKISLTEIIDHLFRIIDPTSLNRQGNDRGRQYRTGVYSEDKEVLEKVKELISEKQKDYDEEIVVEVEELNNYIKAEDYHQDYLIKNPGGYCHVDLSLADVPLYGKYEKMSEEELKDNLTEEQYKVTQNAGTERPYTSEYDDFYEKGIYIDITTKEPLFASTDKYDAGCGWPSFSRPITSYSVDYEEDNSLGMNRIEVKSKTGDAHLGHVFEDGKKDDGGLRYCINGAALEFISYEEMDERGYSEYKKYVK